MDHAVPTFVRGRFIVTADDYGIRETVPAFLELARTGKIDRVAVLVNYITPEEARLLSETGVKIDLHLETIQLLGSGDKVEESAVTRGLNFIWKYVSGQVTAAKVEAEWKKQIEDFQTLFGRLPDGMNSHEHLHFFPRFFRVFLKLGREYDVSFLRFPNKGLLEGKSSIVRAVLGFLWWWNKNTAKSALDESGRPLYSSEYFVSYDWIRDPAHFLEHVPDGTIEILFHPEKEDENRMIRKLF